MKSHRDLIAWQRAHQLTVEVFRYCGVHWKPWLASSFDQLRRAALSVQLNIAEGYASGPGPRCRNHLRIAYASAVEATDIIDLLAELGPEDGVVLSDMSALSHECQALTLLLLKKTRG